MSKDNLLSEEELRNNLFEITLSFMSETAAHQKTFENTIEINLEKYINQIIYTINTQKRLYADSIIGEPKPIDYTHTKEQDAERLAQNSLIYEQRKRLNA